MSRTYKERKKDYHYSFYPTPFSMGHHPADITIQNQSSWADNIRAGKWHGRKSWSRIIHHRERMLERVAFASEQYDDMPYIRRRVKWDLWSSSRII